MKQTDLALLVFIARKAGLHGTYNSSTSEIAKQTSLSQQSVSRKLLQLEKKGLIERKAQVSGVTVSLTHSGTEELKQHYTELSMLFSQKAKKDFSLSGKVVSGIGEGKYYLSFLQYREQFRQKLGFLPYLGTLNLEVEEEKIRDFLSTLTPIHVLGFETKERTFGGLTCYKVMLNNNIPVSLIVPDRTVHPKNQIEIVAKDFLRKKIGLKDGAIVRVSRGE